ncbi:major facilitator superfamily domain-containing protein 6-like, partial [Cololabis saira]|uniref:major facilitator superfamily domain-containing protein 6-like n=1 Tax=Cololabis saira TaxID=129043 RepID=UPI002AD4BE25
HLSGETAPLRRTTMRKQIDIKRALVLAGTFNFLCWCAKASLLPFLTLYFRQLGLSPAMTGIVMGTKCLITLVWSPAASLLAKRYNKRRVVITCSLVLSAAAALLLLLIPPIDVPGARNETCKMYNTSVFPTQSLGDDLFVTGTRPAVTHPKTLVTVPSKSFNGTKPSPVVTTKSSLVPNDTEKLQPGLSNSSAVQHGLSNASAVLASVPGESEMNISVVDPTVTSLVTSVRNKRSKFKSEQAEEKYRNSLGFLGSLKEMDVHNQLFFLILFLVSVWELVSAPLDWTADDGLYEYLDFADASDRHSGAEVWGLLGAACGVGGAGLLVSQLRCLIAAHTPRTAVHFFCYAGLAVLALPAAVHFPLYLSRKRERANGLLKALQLVHGSPHALLCAVTVFLVGVAGSAVENFLLWQMQDQGSSELHMGLALALALLSRASFPLLAGRLSKVLSPRRVLVVGATGLGLQCFYYSLLRGAWAALPAQLLSCLSGGALWWAVNIQCEEVATPGAEKSLRRVYGSLLLHLGSGLGSFAGGFVAQRFGLEWLFRGAAVVLMAWCVSLPLLQWKAPRQRRINYSRLLAADASEASDSDSDQDWLDKAMEDDRGPNNHGRRINP